jgi:putative membrane protein
MSISEANKDKRVSDHLANERTFLAWIRTSIGIMAFGFVVVRFSLFVKQLTLILDKDKLASSSPATQHNGHSAFIGIVLVASGLLTAVFSFVRFMKTKAQIESGEYRSSSPLIWLVTAFIFLVSVLLIVYLIQII